MGSDDAGSIEVNPSGLREFAGSVGSEVDGSFKPGAQRLFTTYEQGVTFGLGNESANVKAARDKHFAALESTSRSMAAYINTAKILIEAVKKTADEYSNADAGSDARTDPTKIFNDAVERARQEQLAADRAEQADLRRRGIQ